MKVYWFCGTCLVKEYFEKCDCLIMAAAVSDYRPLRQSKTKLKKTADKVTIELGPTRDILRWASKHKTGQVVAGFALEDRDVLSRAEKKLHDKKLDMIVANEPTAIGTKKSSVWMYPFITMSASPPLTI